MPARVVGYDRTGDPDVLLAPNGGRTPAWQFVLLDTAPAEAKAIGIEDVAIGRVLIDVVQE